MKTKTEKEYFIKKYENLFFNHIKMKYSEVQREVNEFWYNITAKTTNRIEWITFEEINTKELILKIQEYLKTNIVAENATIVIRYIDLWINLKMAKAKYIDEFSWVVVDTKTKQIHLWFLDKNEKVFNY